MELDRLAPSTLVAPDAMPGKPEPRTNGTAVAVAAIATASLPAVLVLPLALVCLLASAALVLVIGAHVFAGPLHRAFVADAQARARYDRRIARMRALPDSAACYHALAELTYLVDETARRDPSLVERHELETLLDRHVALTIAHQQAQRAAAMSDRTQLEHLLEATRADPRASRRRLEVCERRLRYQDHCEATARALADELANVADLVRMVAQRAACPELGAIEAESEVVDRQVAQLDADELARQALTELG